MTTTRVKTISTGVWSGLFGGLALIAISLVLRWAAGIGTLPELLSDRIAPLMGIHLFFFLIGTLKSYALLKQIGILSMLINELLAGLVFGLFLAWQQRVAPAKARGRFLLAVALVFVAVTAFIWGNLTASYLGLPPASATLVSVLGLAVSAIVFAFAILWANGVLGGASEAFEAATQNDAGRRAVLVGGGSTVLAAFSVLALVHFYRVASYSYDGTVNEGDNLPPVTPNDKFYSVTKNNVDPDPTLAAWGLEVNGHVAKSMKLHLADLEAMSQTRQQTTLQCISDPTGGFLSSNAVWTGVPLKDILARAGASGKAVQVMFHGADGFVDTISIEAAMQPYTLVAHKMNGVTIPTKHGYPVRLIVPGYVGEKSVKWLTGIEVREKPGEGFYEEQGWGPHFAIENSSRFDAPSDGDDSFKLHQPIEMHGEAYGGDRGVRAVQISTDGGDTWNTAELTYPGTKISWAQWKYSWTPDEAGDVTLGVRCIDGDGGIQSADVHPNGPGQYSGRQMITVTVKA